MGMILTINTNGTLLDEDGLTSLDNISPAGSISHYMGQMILRMRNYAIIRTVFPKQ